jgi:hypothetical protein
MMPTPGALMFVIWVVTSEVALFKELFYTVATAVFDAVILTHVDSH